MRSERDLRGGGRRLAHLAAVLLSAAIVSVIPGDAPANPLPERAIEIVAQRIESFRIGRPEFHTFGRLRFIGGLELEGNTRNFGGLSGLVMRRGGKALTAITDRGVLLVATVERDADGRPTGMADARIRGMTALDPTLLIGPNGADSEGFDTAGDEPGDAAWISFETTPRILAGRLDADGFVGDLEPLELPPDILRLRWTKGLESLAVAPADSPIAGRIVVLAERPPLNAATGNRPGWILGGDAAPIAFEIVDDGFDLTDAAFGPDGDLYVLERLFTLSKGSQTRIRRIAVGELRPGAVVDGPEIMAADLSHQIDNMEGMDIWIDAGGRTVVSLVSDDNQSFMQRTVYLEFELLTP
ncbi:MAG TPA: esterase-like activity of phytase family protein [Methylomirabilota bacterium]|nr:esterase-like activity of phytase family protein [Methylomirabilota bacterium]